MVEYYFVNKKDGLTVDSRPWRLSQKGSSHVLYFGLE